MFLHIEFKQQGGVKGIVALQICYVWWGNI
jgi:hypothetical protein